MTDDGRRTPSDGKSSHCLWQGELKTNVQDDTYKHQLFKERYKNVDYLISRKSTFIPSSVKEFAFFKRLRESIRGQGLVIDNA
jgi:hypothetical protein